eukprot:CAMPEP_0119295828 /NCGR_PEP_ID=MMETSP1329-20130426/50261_1 /TAXON_ID=114041 /ORGANISM="Genus nov. species nov., Strain RCC1024" /LENGTH=110 /DNA_ID=CAMNT_0007296749 /DNA_START=632 /DNA_END=964 /DNA_ORIENTATION=+
MRLRRPSKMVLNALDKQLSTKCREREPTPEPRSVPAETQPERAAASYVGPLALALHQALLVNPAPGAFLPPPPPVLKKREQRARGKRPKHVAPPRAFMTSHKRPLGRRNA